MESKLIESASELDLTDAMHRVTMVGNDLALDNGIGMCGKNRQGVPVGVGQPTIRMNAMTVGRTGV